MTSIDACRSFSISEVCAQTGLGRTAVYGAIKSGVLVARKHGRRTIVLANDLAEFLQGLPHAGKAGEFDGGTGWSV